MLVVGLFFVSLQSTPCRPQNNNLHHDDSEPASKLVAVAVAAKLANVRQILPVAALLLLLLPTRCLLLQVGSTRFMGPFDYRSSSPQKKSFGVSWWHPSGPIF
jgi:hypothetical protein